MKFGLSAGKNAKLVESTPVGFLGKKAHGKLIAKMQVVPHADSARLPVRG